MQQALLSWLRLVHTGHSSFTTEPYETCFVKLIIGVCYVKPVGVYVLIMSFVERGTAICWRTDPKFIEVETG